MTGSRNFVTFGYWTFDAGVSLTTGFHLLYGYLLAALYAVAHPSPETFVTASMVLSWLGGLPAIVVAGAFLVHVPRLVPLLVFFVMAMSLNVNHNLMWPMEWSLVVSAAAAFCLALWRVGESESGALWSVAAFGFLGSLARSDFGLLPAAMLTASIVTPGRGPDRRVRAAAVGAGGATLGLAVVFLHTYSVTGHLLQSSVRTKAHWAQTLPASTIPIRAAILTMFGAPNRLTSVLVLALAALALLAGLRIFRKRGRESLALQRQPGLASVLWIGSVFACAGYVALYAQSAVFPWYTANLAVPVFLALALPFAAAGVSKSHVTAAAGLLLVIAAREVRDAPDVMRSPPFGFMSVVYDAGLYLRDAGLNQRVGSVSAGVVAYYQGGSIVNLDGLMNDDVYDYSVRNALEEYIDRRAIGYVIEFDELIRMPRDDRRRLGLDSASFLSRLQPIRTFGAYPPFGQMTLFRFAPRR